MKRFAPPFNSIENQKRQRTCLRAPCLFYIITWEIPVEYVHACFKKKCFAFLFLFVDRRNHLHISIQELRRAGVVAFFSVHGVDLCHFPFVEGEVEQSEIVPDVGRIFRPGDDDVATLDVPALPFRCPARNRGEGRGSDEILWECLMP